MIKLFIGIIIGMLLFITAYLIYEKATQTIDDNIADKMIYYQKLSDYELNSTKYKNDPIAKQERARRLEEVKRLLYIQNRD
jgi:hypothetical protein